MKTANIRKIVARAGKVLLAVLLGLNLITVFLSVTNLRGSFGWLPYTALSVQGGSMEPAMSEGDLIIIHETPYTELKIGDDVTFFTANGLVTHRIVDKNADGFVTQGLANKIADADPLGANAYCGKVVYQIPMLGLLLQWLCGSTVTLVLWALLVVAGCFGKPILQRLLGEQDPQGGHAKAGAIGTRSLVCLTCLSLLLCLPFLTSAKYTAQINRFETAVAAPRYLSSNYLSQDGNSYSIQGWNGRPYTLKLEIRNYNNVLLFNQAELTYGLGVKIHTDAQYNSAYTVRIEAEDAEYQTIELDAFGFPESWEQEGIQPRLAYRLGQGEKIAHSFVVTIEPNDPDEPLPSGVDICFDIFACTGQNDSYFVELHGNFHLQVAEVFQFVGQKQVSDVGSMVEVSITTNLVNDASDEKIVLFQWDPNDMYINEFESTAFNVITNNPTYYNKAQGRLYMKLQAYSKVNLEFFKKIDFTADADDVLVQVVESIGQDPQIEGQTGESGT